MVIHGTKEKPADYDRFVKANIDSVSYNTNYRISRYNTNLESSTTTTTTITITSLTSMKLIILNFFYYLTKSVL
jgi:hypothetical protein